MVVRQSPPDTVVAHGWAICLHPLFRAQLTKLRREVENIKLKTPTRYASHNKTKRLAAIERLVFDAIPQNPARPEYRQGDTLGSGYRHWFRAKFFQQYRLLFRYHAGERIIVFAWVNDEQTKRAYESDDDAYRVFRKMLLVGNPADDWDDLVRASRK